MAGVENQTDNVDTTLPKSSDLNNSLVKKVTALIPTSISKWFGKSSLHTRRRESESDQDDILTEQPPAKRLRIPDRNDYDNFHISAPRTANGTIPNVPTVSVKTQVRTSDFLNNIRPRQSLHRNIDLDWSTSVSRNTPSTSNYLQKEYDTPIAVAGPSGVQKEPSTDRTIFNSVSQATTPDRTEEVNSDNVTRIHPSKRTFKTSSLFSNDSSRSLFPDCTTPERVSLSSRRPTFNSPAFGSPTLIDNTLTSERIAKSPFYTGRTMFGGSSAGYLTSPTSSSVRRNSLNIKPINDKKKDSLNMSQAAKRILDVLENFNSPADDAKKIPRLNISSKHLSGLEEKRKKLLNLRSPYARINKPTLPTKELTIPTVPDILQIKSSVKRVGGNNNVKSTVSKKVDETPQLPELPSNLSNISLPITTLPSFEFIKKPPVNFDKEKKCEKPTPVTPILQTPSPIVQQTTAPSPRKVETSFKFAQPIKIGTSCTKSLLSINNFKFSKPINIKEPESKSDQVDNKNTETLKEETVPVESIWECKMCMVKNKMDDTKCVSCKTVKNSSLNSTTSNSQKEFSPADFKIGDKWECSTCLVRNNNADERCVCCTALKPGAKPSLPMMNTSTGLEKFKPSQDTWECSTCMIRNKKDAIKCLACETLKDKPATTNNTFGKEFFKKTTEWECPSCLVRNADNKMTCACCDAPKPGGTVITKWPTIVETTPFKFGIDKADISTNDAKPATGFLFGSGNTTSSTTSSSMTSTFTFGVQPTTTSSTSAPAATFNFGVPAAAPKTTSESKTETIEVKPQATTPKWECPTCMVRNDDDKLACVCCETAKPGAEKKSATSNTVPASTPQFKFGIDKVDSVPATTTTLSATPSFTFGVPTSTVTSTVGGFVFGTNSKPLVTSSSSPTENKVNDTVTTSPKVSSSIIFTPISSPLTTPSLPKVPTTLTSTFGSPQNSKSLETNTTMFKATNGPSLVSSTTASTVFGQSTFELKPSTTTASTFGSTPVNFSFGEKKDEQPNKPPTFSFGNGNVTTTVATPAAEVKTTAPLLFGTQPEKKPMFMFGSTSGKTENKTGFNFEEKKTPAAAPSSLFTFGATSTNVEKKPAPSTPFTFGAGNNVEATPPKLPAFDFKSTTNFDSFAKPTGLGAAAPSGGLGSAVSPPTFGSGNNNAASINSFGTPPAAASAANPSFGAAAPVFGSMSTGVSANAFQFGATANQTTSSPAPIVFNFGGGSNQVSGGIGGNSTGGFSFGNVQKNTTSTPAIPTFNPNTKPVFNFTSAPPSFSAQSTLGSQLPSANPQRRIKKAVRRTRPAP